MGDILKWCEIGSTQTHRYNVLSQFLSQEGVQNEFRFIEVNESNLKEKIEEAKSQNFNIRFHPTLFDKVSGNIENNLKEIETLKSIDGLVYESEKGYWPEILLRESIFEYLTMRVKALDVSQKAFVVGSSGLARAGISALIKLGFSKINLTCEDDTSADLVIEDFKKIFFNVEFEHTKRSDVTILPGTHGLVLNTISILDSASIPTEIFYFNFLKKGGLVVDVVDLPIDSPLTKIAEDIGAEVIRGFEILAHYDLNWVQKLTGQKLSLEPYQKALENHLSQVEYDKNKVQKILEEFQM